MNLFTQSALRRLGLPHDSKAYMTRLLKQVRHLARLRCTLG